jgi:hypothetical protein
VMVLHGHIHALRCVGSASSDNQMFDGKTSEFEKRISRDLHAKCVVGQDLF